MANEINGNNNEAVNTPAEEINKEEQVNQEQPAAPAEPKPETPAEEPEAPKRKYEFKSLKAINKALERYAGGVGYEVSSAIQRTADAYAGGKKVQATAFAGLITPLVILGAPVVGWANIERYDELKKSYESMAPEGKEVQDWWVRPNNVVKLGVGSILTFVAYIAATIALKKRG